MENGESVFVADPVRIRESARRICVSTGDVRIAVAFWGRGAAKSLGLDERNAEAVRIVVNAQTGGCNPSELRLLLKRFGENVRTNASLHAKLYANQDEVLVGSANASANGLGFDGDDEVEGWAEACVHSRAPTVCSDASRWFESIWDESMVLTPEIIRQADELWRRAKGLAGRRAASIDPLARGAFVVLTSVGRDADALALLADRQKEEPDIDAYQGWAPPCSALLLDFMLKKGKVFYENAWVSPRRPEPLADSTVGRKLNVVRKASDQKVRMVCGTQIWRVRPVDDVSAVVRYLRDKERLDDARREIANRYPKGFGAELEFPDDFCIPLEFFKDLVTKALAAR